MGLIIGFLGSWSSHAVGLGIDFWISEISGIFGLRFLGEEYKNRRQGLTALDKWA